MLSTKFIAAIEHNLVRGLLLTSALAASGCVATEADLESDDEMEFMEDEDAVNGQVRLPIEVLGAEGLVRTVEVTVDNPANVTHLRLSRS